MCNEQCRFDDTYDYIYLNWHSLCFGSFLFLARLSGEPEGLYLSHHLDFYVLFSSTYPLLGKLIRKL